MKAVACRYFVFSREIQSFFSLISFTFSFRMGTDSFEQFWTIENYILLLFPLLFRSKASHVIVYIAAFIFFFIEEYCNIFFLSLKYHLGEKLCDVCL